MVKRKTKRKSVSKTKEPDIWSFYGTERTEAGDQAQMVSDLLTMAKKKHFCVYDNSSEIEDIVVVSGVKSRREAIAHVRKIKGDSDHDYQIWGGC